jgi:hypothetical protein
MNQINCIVKKIIKEEDTKKYKLGFNPEVGKDYLLLEEKEYNIESKKNKYKIFKLLSTITILPSIFFIFAAFSFEMTIPFVIIGTIVMLSFLLFVNLSYPKANNIQIKQLIPVEKTPKLNVGDEVELNIFINKK